MNVFRKQKLSTSIFVGFRFFGSIKSYIVALITIILLLSSVQGRVTAQISQADIPVNTNACEDSSFIVESFFELSSGSYDFTVVSGGEFISSIYFTNQNKSCQLLDAGITNELTIPQAELYSVQIIFKDSYAGEKPQIVMTSSQDESITGCRAVNGCPYDYEGELVTLYPIEKTGYFDNIELFLYDDMVDNQISTVKYAVDSRVVYESKMFEKFNMNYVPPGDQKLQTKIEFENRMYAVKSEDAKTGTYADLFILARSWLYQNQQFLLYPLIFLVALSVLAGIQKLRVWRHERKLWRQEHIATDIEAQHQLSEGHVIDSEVDETLQTVGSAIKKPLIFVALALAVVMMSSRYAITFVRTDGESMLQTLQDNQQMLVNRGGRTFASLRKADYTPKRGDIIIFERTSEGAVGEKSLLVKRVIGLPGDTVEVQDQEIIAMYEVNGKKVEFVDSQKSWYDTVSKSQFNGKLSVTLGVGEIFVVGDNRDGSIDSRFFGPIKAESVYGKVLRGL